jgi:RNA polymerase sigma-70 factor (ECF subfamily)
VQADDESTWIRQAQTGDRDAFAELVKRYWSRIYRWLQGTTGCAHSAEDLTQEVFIRAWQAIPKFTDRYFRAWLFRIASNAWIDSQRRNQEKSIDGMLDETPTKEPGPLGELLARETELNLHQACQALPASVRSAFLLWIQEEMPYGEIAQSLEITEATARWRVFRARQLLMRVLSSQRD